MNKLNVLNGWAVTGEYFAPRSGKVIQTLTICYMQHHVWFE